MQFARVIPHVTTSVVAITEVEIIISARSTQSQSNLNIEHLAQQEMIENHTVKIFGESGW